MYRECFFDIDVLNNEKFDSDIRQIFKNNKWEIIEDESRLFAKKGKSILYLNTISVNGIIEDGLRKEVERILDGRSFKYLRTDVYDTVYDWDDKDYKRYFSRIKREIAKDILTACDPEWTVYNRSRGEFYRIKEDYKRRRFEEGNSEKIEWECIDNIIYQLVKDGELLYDFTRYPRVFRCGNDKVKKSLGRYVSWCKKNNYDSTDEKLADLYIKIVYQNDSAYQEKIVEVIRHYFVMLPEAKKFLSNYKQEHYGFEWLNE